MSTATAIGTGPTVTLDGLGVSYEDATLIDTISYVDPITGLAAVTTHGPGMTVGAGFEYMFAPSWSVFVEYNYMWFLDDTATHMNPNPGFTGEVLNVSQRAQTAMVGINYKFHWDGPVVAKY